MNYFKKILDDYKLCPFVWAAIEIRFGSVRIFSAGLYNDYVGDRPIGIVQGHPSWEQ